MRVEWTDEFDRWLARIEDKAERGDAHANRQLDYIAAELALLRDLDRAPRREEETAQLKWIRQHRKHEVWRVSHRFDEHVAIRLIVWTPMMNRRRVTTMARTKTTPKGFVDGTGRIDRLLSDPERAKRVEQIRADGREMDRIHAMNLAMIRRAAEMTQEEVAEKLGGRQGDVSRIENRHDLLLSTLLNYLTATGAQDPRIVVTLGGQEVELDLAQIAHKSGEIPQSPI